jgi:alpha/beta superfamily hydrolase
MATDWVSTNPYTEKFQLGYFASSTGGAAALIAACEYKIKSLVIRSGRTDLVEKKFLEQIASPCLFIAGSKEKSVIKISKETMEKMRNSNETKLSIIEGASHMFEEQGAMQTGAELATQWLTRHFLQT